MRSPMKKKHNPAKKKQKKASKVAEVESRASEMEDLSEHVAKEARKVSVEILSGEEESEAEGKGSSSDRTDIVVDSPPVNPADAPSDQPSKPKSPPPASQPTIAPSEQEQIPPSQPVEEEAPAESQPQHQSAKGISTVDVVASEDTAAEVESQKVKAPAMRVKHGLTHIPFRNKKKGETAAVLGTEAGKEEEESNLQ